MKYEFIEIGTSDFRTEIELCDDTTHGISVEPIKMYLDALPNKKNVIKANYAISDKDSTTNVYYIKPEQIIKYDLPYWVRGCNSIINPHPAVVDLLGDKHDDVVVCEVVKIIKWETFVSLYDIEGVKYLKIDTEGHDGVILSEYYDFCLNNKNLLAEKILFENNYLANKELNEEMIIKFKDLGYTGEQVNYDYVLEKK